MNPLKRFIRAVFHGVFCWNAVQLVPDLACFASMDDYLFPVTCMRCGARGLYEGRNIRAAIRGETHSESED